MHDPASKKLSAPYQRGSRQDTNRGRRIELRRFIAHSTETGHRCASAGWHAQALRGAHGTQGCETKPRPLATGSSLTKAGTPRGSGGTPPPDGFGDPTRLWRNEGDVDGDKMRAPAVACPQTVLELAEGGGQQRGPLGRLRSDLEVMWALRKSSDCSCCLVRQGSLASLVPFGLATQALGDTCSMKLHKRHNTTTVTRMAAWPWLYKTRVR